MHLDICSWLTNLSTHIGPANRQRKHNKIEDHTQPSSDILTTQRTRTCNTHIHLHVDDNRNHFIQKDNSTILWNSTHTCFQRKDGAEHRATSGTRDWDTEPSKARIESDRISRGKRQMRYVRLCGPIGKQSMGFTRHRDTGDRTAPSTNKWNKYKKAPEGSWAE